MTTKEQRPAMAAWISSKLKVAESFLQQIDQQAAETLSKTDAPLSPSNAPADDIPKRADSSRPLKYQLPRKSSPSTSPRPGSDPLPIKSAVIQPLVPPSPPTSAKPAIADGDWTELLSSTPAPTVALARSGGSIRNPAAPIPSALGKGVHKGSSGGGGRPKNGKSPGPSSEGEVVKNQPSKGQQSLPSSRRSPSLLDLTKDLFSQELQSGSDAVLSKTAIHREQVSSKVDEDSSTLDTKDGVVTGDGDGGRLSGESKHSSIAVMAPGSSNLLKSSSGSEEESDLGSDSASTSDSEDERKRREERRKKREKIRAERMVAMAAQAIREKENVVARLEGEKLSLEKILEERQKKQAEEASELQMSMIETMEAVEMEKQRHNSTRMEALARLAELEARNSELARLLAMTQGNLDLEVNRIGELRQLIEMRELAQEEYRRNISKIHQIAPSINEIESIGKSKLEQEILGAEYVFVSDKITKLKEKANNLKENIQRMRMETVHPTEVEVELKKRLDQLTDLLIQKQTQVEALSSEKATMMLRIETVSRFLDESGVLLQSADSADGLAGTSGRLDIEAGTWQAPHSALRPGIQDRIKSGKMQLGSVLLQLDSIFSAGAIFLRRNPKAQFWSLLYLLCLHFWVFYILISKPQVSNDARSGAVYSLEAINKTGG